MDPTREIVRLLDKRDRISRPGGSGWVVSKDFRYATSVDVKCPGPPGTVFVWILDGYEGWGHQPWGTSHYGGYVGRRVLGTQQAQIEYTTTGHLIVTFTEAKSGAVVVSSV